MDPNQTATPVTDQTDATPKQQAIERLRQANNVLVTVKTSPSVDQLAATIGLTLMLNKLGKHATAVFSGEVPSTIEFLKPEETLETNTDSLQDFIVSLDKSKADKLRYKVEENVVRIYITPYKTSLSENDLEFSLGDFNVDAVVALGVTQRDDLDQAIVSHGRILHDATVITVTAGQVASDLGQINWQDQAASSLSEMLVSASEAFQGGLIDEQIATAFLTGIVSETERFSNPKTSPKVMTMAAQLMASGANQQLIANELEKAVEVELEQLPEEVPAELPSVVETTESNDGSLSIDHSEVLPTAEETQPEFEAAPSPDMEPEPEPVPEPEPEPEPAPPPPPPVLEEPVQEEPANEIDIDHEGNLTRASVEPKHKVIQPLAPPPQQPIAAPLPVAEPPADEPVSAPEMPEAPAEQTAVVAENTSTLPPPPGLDLTPSAPIQDDTTLAEIEQTVQSPHADSYASVDGARNEVQTALNQASFDPAGQSRADLNALPFAAPDPEMANNFQLPEPPAATETNASFENQPQDEEGLPPPPVPPPMTAL